MSSKVFGEDSRNLVPSLLSLSRVAGTRRPHCSHCPGGRNPVALHGDHSQWDSGCRGANLGLHV